MLINFTRIYFRGCIPIRNIIKPIRFPVSLCDLHILREMRILTKLFQCHSKGPLLHSKRTKCVISSKTKNDYTDPVWRNWVQTKINKQKTSYAVTGLGLLRVPKQGTRRGKLVRSTGKWKMETKQIIENEVTDRASVQVRFCSQFSFSCSSCSLPAPLSSFL